MNKNDKNGMNKKNEIGPLCVKHYIESIILSLVHGQWPGGGDVSFWVEILVALLP